MVQLWWTLDRYRDVQAVEAAARTAGRNGDEPGDLSMTRHGLLHSSAAGAQPPATDRRMSMVIKDVEGVTSGSSTSRQYRVAERRSSPCASIAVSSCGGHAIADTRRKSKFL
jgi:hypothetical protein